MGIDIDEELGGEDDGEGGVNAVHQGKDWGLLLRAVASVDPSGVLALTAARRVRELSRGRVDHKVLR